jgi:hypothetical protein
MAIDIASHIGEDTLERYALGHLSEELTPSLEEHLLLCETCRDRLEKVEQFIQVVSIAASELEHETAKQKTNPLVQRLAWLWSVPKPVWVGAMAAVALMVLIPYYHLDGPPTEVRLSNSTRGVEESLSTPAKAGKALLVIDTTQLPRLQAYQLRVVNSNGSEVWTGSVPALGHEIRVEPPVRFSAGSYWVRIYTPDGRTQLRELGLKVR